MNQNHEQLTMIEQYMHKMLEFKSQAQEDMDLLWGGDLLHVSTRNYVNFGDYMLNIMVKLSVQNMMDVPICWADCRVNRPFDVKMAYAANRSKAILVGGGGLFYKRNAQQPGSWQWNISKDAIARLEVPVFLFAVGYNQFYNQESLGNDFKEEINLLAEKCGFIGLRNQGSIRELQKILTEENQQKIRYQPCPTTIISKLFDLGVLPPTGQKPVIAVNMAFDRSENRFRDDEHRTCVVNQTALVLKEFSETHTIRIYIHVNGDEMFLDVLRHHQVPHEVVDLRHEQDISKIIQLYSEPEVVIGMRGHAQMIPFGLATPIVSIVSHPKMAYFLEDIEHPEWGVHVSDDAYEENLMQAIQYALHHKAEIQNEILTIQDRLIDITYQNVQEMQKYIGFCDIKNLK